MGVLLLARHGQASFGADDYDVLSEAGHEQSRTLGRWLAEQGQLPASVLHGGMRRQRETWEGVAAGAGLTPGSTPVAEADEDWAEFDFLAVLAHHETLTGERMPAGADRRAFQQHFEKATGHWSGHRGGPEDDAPYPEPYDAFVARTRAALDRAADRPGPTLVVSSGGVIAAIAAALVAPEATPLGPIWARFNTVIANTSVTRVIVGETGARLLTFNEHTHLSRDQVTYR